MRIITVIALSISILTGLNSQKVEFKKERLEGVQKIATINFNDIDDPYFINLKNLEAPAVSGNSYKKYLSELKEGLTLSHPKNNNLPISKRSIVNPPETISSFSGLISPDVGIPLDNHLATNGGQVISAMNSQIAIKSSGGDDLVGFSLESLAEVLNLPDRFFDPRVLYDTEADRFIIVFLHGSDSENTNIIVAFSATNDATGDWHVYELTGNPNNDSTWTDYPMINVTQTDLVVTGNLIFDNQPWQTGFAETVLWQIDKTNGYAGVPLVTNLYQDIVSGSTFIRNLCPVESADESLEASTYFLSNRNFSVENDTFFLVELRGGINDPNTSIEIDVLISDVAYGVPPNAEMFFGELQTNDARVLEAFYLDNEIQFVGNTRNLSNNKAGIYHGTIFDVSGGRDVNLRHLIGPEFEIGYPGITHTGIDPGENDVILTFGHTAKNLNTGISAVYYDPVFGYSDIISIKDGEGYIGMISGPLERWGDYAGSQRDFSDPGTCWISGFYGNSARVNMPWVVKLTRPSTATPVLEQEISNNEIRVFPNPVAERFSMTFEIGELSSDIEILLFNQNGALVDKLYASTSIKSGLNEFSFDISTLSAGHYIIAVNSGRTKIASQSLIVSE